VDCGGFVCCGEFNKCGESRPAPFGWNAITSEREFVERLVRFLLKVLVLFMFFFSGLFKNTTKSSFWKLRRDGTVGVIVCRETTSSMTLNLCKVNLVIAYK
jgi:hypothetical protein